MNEGGGVSGMFLEHYAAMTSRAISDIVDKAAKHWQVLDATVIHRVGQLQPLDQIVFVGVASGHRGDAFAACEFIMDFLKTRAPFWKKETTPQGEHWVEARASDDTAADRWK
jgi:molybdopterin synthase catalytic subunit